MNTIVIDCGASFLKGALYLDSNIIKQISKKSPVVHGSEPIERTIQIDALMNNVEIMLDDLSKDLDTFRLCISNEMHGFILTDKNINPIIDYISWQKEYGNIGVRGVCSKEYLMKYKENEIAASGMPIRAGLPSSNLHYLSRNLNIDISCSYFLTLGDYILSKLAKKIVSCHPTNAAATGLFSISNMDWNYEYFSYVSNYKNIILPSVGDGRFTFEYKGKTVEARPALGDQQAALLGSGFKTRNQISFNLGTGAQVSVLVSEDECCISSNYQLRPYFYGMLLKTIPHIPSGRAANVFIRFYKSVLASFSVDVSEDVIWGKILSSCDARELKISLSFFENAISNCTKGGIENISENNLTFENLSASFIDQMGQNFIDVSKRIVDKKNVSEVVFSGGIARRIKRIRDIIMKEFKTDYYVSENETLNGLYIYSLMD